MRMSREGTEFEALWLLRTFVRGPAALQWAVAGQAPAPRLADRSRPRPRHGNGRERLTRLTAHRRIQPLHSRDARAPAVAGAHLHRPKEHKPAVFSKPGSGSSSTICAKEAAVRRPESN